MTAKEYFTKLRKLDRRINATLDDAAHCRHMAEKATAAFTAERISGTSMRSKVESFTCKLIDLERLADKQVDELVDQRRVAEYLISQIGDERYRDILTYRYINGWAWEKIRSTVGYQEAQCYRMHGKALEQLSVIGVWYHVFDGKHDSQ